MKVELITTTAKYRPAIDGLRGIAVGAVFLFHLNRKWLPGGFVGVDVFFVISGFLITSIILRDCAQSRFSLARFYQRRIARLLPTLLAVTLTTLGGAFLFYSEQDLASLGLALSATMASIANLKFITQGNYFLLSLDAQPLLHCWSLSIEEQFYFMFPIAFVWLYQSASHRITLVLSLLCFVSIASCIWITYIRPDWAFYLLPTRAWEILVGSLLAIFNRSNPTKGRFLNFLPYIGLGMIMLSFMAISEDLKFPGYVAALPVLGTACFFMHVENSSTNIIERFLSWKPLVLLGTVSYSLYLWHWPIFSFVDYRFYFESLFVRIILKIFFSVLATAICFTLLERPARNFFNHPCRKRLAFLIFFGSLALLIPLGIFVRQTNYINSRLNYIAKGGRLFNPSGKNGSIVLMGDSHASMYGKMVVELAKEHNFKLNVISVDGGDALPRTLSPNSPHWVESLKFVKRERPDFLLLVCDWSSLVGNSERLKVALETLQPFSNSIILITQPPKLPEFASRDGIRGGKRPPFFENPYERARRIEINNILQDEQFEKVHIVNIEPLFSEVGGNIRFVDESGTQLYQDSAHLSGAGAKLVKNFLLTTIQNASHQ